MFNYRKCWKHLVENKNAKSYHVIQYQILKAIETKKQFGAVVNLSTRLIAKAFNPVNNVVKLHNGQDKHRALKEALYEAKLFVNVLGAPPDAIPKELKFLLDDVISDLYTTDWDEYYTRNYVYIFVRQDISPEYQLVQSSHVALKIGHALGKDYGCKKYSYDEVSNLYFTVVGVPNINALTEIIESLNFHKRNWVIFNEPDLGNQPTAIATYPINALNRGELLTYKRLNFYGN